MFQTFVITLREGIEAFLIVAISLAYLRKSGRGALAPAVYAGIGAALVVSVGMALWLRATTQQSLMEGILACVAAVLVASLTVHLWFTARHMRAHINASIENAAQRPGPAALAGVFLFVVLMMSREGIETALLINALMGQTDSGSLITGALAGVGGAALLAWAWGRYGQRVNLARFFQVTAVFLLVFVVQLLIYGFHELAEADALPFDTVTNLTWHARTEIWGPEGPYGFWLSASMVLLPLGWLAWTALQDGRRKSLQQTQSLHQIQ